MGPKKQDFWSVSQKLGIILENKVVQKFKLKNYVPTKNWSPYMKKKCRFLTSTFDFQSTILELFEELSLIDGFKKKILRIN